MLDRHTGRSRGFGYVTFESREALQAGLALNGSRVGGKQLFVAESKPPTGPRESSAGARSERGGSRGGSHGGIGLRGRGGGAGRRGGRGRGGAFVPRGEGALRLGLGAPAGGEASAAPAHAPKSNEDFRKMFLPATPKNSLPPPFPDS